MEIKFDLNMWLPDQSNSPFILNNVVGSELRYLLRLSVGNWNIVV